MDQIKIKKRGEDGYQVISLRIRRETLDRLDGIASETNRSRNEVINILLQYGIEHVEIE